MFTRHEHFPSAGFCLASTSLKSLVYFMCVSLSIGRKQCNAGSCWGPPAFPFLVGIVPQNQGLHWSNLDQAGACLGNPALFVFVCPSLSFEPTLTLSLFLQQLLLRMSLSFPCCGHSRCLQSHSLHQHNPKKLLGAPHFLQNPAVFQKNASSTGDFSFPRSWAGLSLWLSLWQWCFQGRMQELDAHTAPGRGRDTCGCVQLWCHLVTKAIYLIIWSFDGVTVVSWFPDAIFGLGFSSFCGLLGFLLGTDLRWERDDRRCHGRSVSPSVLWWGTTSVPCWIGHPFLPQAAKYSAATKTLIKFCGEYPRSNWELKYQEISSPAHFDSSLPNSFWKYLLFYCSCL